MNYFIDVFYSFRSPYCYLLNKRLIQLEYDWDLTVNIRPVYPLAIRDKDFFIKADPLRRAYHILDSLRLAEFLGLPYRRPIPDPVVSDLNTDTFSDQQPYITPITRLAVAACLNGDGLSFTNAVMNMMWDGSTNNWHEIENLYNAVSKTGLDWNKLCITREENIELIDKEIIKNQEWQRKAGHWGVPLIVFDGEPFYGQDRFPELLWCLKKAGITPRSNSS